MFGGRVGPEKRLKRKKSFTPSMKVGVVSGCETSESMRDETFEAAELKGGTLGASAPPSVGPGGDCERCGGDCERDLGCGGCDGCDGCGGCDESHGIQSNGVLATEGGAETTSLGGDAPLGPTAYAGAPAPMPPLELEPTLTGGGLIR